MTTVTFTINDFEVTPNGDVLLKVSNETLLQLGYLLMVGPYTVTVTDERTAPPAADSGDGVEFRVGQRVAVVRTLAKHEDGTVINFTHDAADTPLVVVRLDNDTDDVYEFEYADLRPLDNLIAAKAPTPAPKPVNLTKAQTYVIDVLNRGNTIQQDWDYSWRSKVQRKSSAPKTIKALFDAGLIVEISVNTEVGWRKQIKLTAAGIAALGGGA